MLTESDVPGALLSEPLESHTCPALRWWLTCHGISAPMSWNKAKLISRSVLIHMTDALLVTTLVLLLHYQLCNTI